MSFVDGFLNLFKVQDDEFDDDYDYDEDICVLIQKDKIFSYYN